MIAPRIAVVGGGISGLVAAYRLRTRLGPDADITVIERSPLLGGKLHTAMLADEPVDVGAEAFIARRPEVPELLAELGLADEIVHPGDLGPLLWSQGALHPVPKPTLMGIPAGPEPLHGLVDDATVRWMADEPTRPLRWEPGSDVDVARLVGDRFGRQVVERSVDPMLGGVYSGLADSIGVRAALPTLADALDAGAPSLTDAVRAALPTPKPGPVFGALRDGYGTLLAALEREAKVHVVHAETTGLRRLPGGWDVDPIGPVDGVMLAVPSTELAALLVPIAPGAASGAASIPLASSAVVALALPTDAGVPRNTGILVASDSPLAPSGAAKAFTMSSRKWPHLAERDVTLVRASYGRFGDASIVDASDTELIHAAIRDFGTVTGVTVTPVDVAVHRWHGGLPQYLPGHLDRVAEIEDGVAPLPRLEVCGALLRGVGVPACIATAGAAAQRLADALDA